MKKILLIDDDKLLSGSICEDLRYTYNYEVSWCDAGQALPELEYFNHDVIILDIMMPVPNNWTREEQKDAGGGLNTGIVLFKKIRKNHPSKPILIFSLKDCEFELDQFTKHLRKPVLIRDIAATLNHLLKNQNQ